MSPVRTESINSMNSTEASLSPVSVKPSRFSELRPGFKMRINAQHTSSIALIGLSLAAFIVLLMKVIFANSYDNDVWFFLATGEYIIKHGIPYTNPFSIQSDMGFVAQQWLHCVIIYALYSWGGFVLTGIWTCVLSVAVFISFCLLGIKLRKTTSHLGIVTVLVFLIILTCSPYLSVRPHAFSMMAYAWIIWICENYRQTKSRKCLCFLPIITLVHVNIHAAMIPLDFFIIALYALPAIPAKLTNKITFARVSFVQADYLRKPLLFVLIACCVSVLINPYGLKGALYVFYSFSSANTDSMIREMQPLTPFSTPVNMVLFALMLCGFAALCKNGLRNINLPLSVLMLIGILGSVMYIRNLWVGGMFCGFYLIWSTSRWKNPFSFSFKGDTLFAAVLVACSLAFGIYSVIPAALTLQKYPQDSTYTPTKTVQYLNSLNIDKANTRVLTFFNSGGYLEYEGFKVNVDPRPEIWSSKISGKGIDYFEEYAKMRLDANLFKLYVSKYNFDVFIIPNEQNFDSFFTNNANYVEIQGGNGYRSWAKKTWLDKQNS